MGHMLNSHQNDDGSVRLSIVVDKEEALQLQGYLQEVFAFAEAACTHKTRMVAFGPEKNTWYFKLPADLAQKQRKGRKPSGIAKPVPHAARCLRFETPDKVFFVYIAGKDENPMDSAMLAQDQQSSRPSSLSLLRSVSFLFWH